MLSQTGKAQSTKVDSLEKVLQRQLPDSIRIKAINELILFYNDINTERTVELSKEALSLVGKTSNIHDIGTTYLRYASAVEAIGEYTTSIEYNAKALTIFKSLNDSTKISIILNNMGIGYNQIGDYSMAVYYLLRAIEIDELRNDLLGACYDYVNIAEVYYNSKNFSAAENWGKKSFERTQQLGEESLLGYTAEMLAIAHIEMGKLDSAKILIALSQKLAQQYNNEYLINRNTSHLGRVFLKHGNYDSARIYFLKAIKQSDGKHFSDVLLPSLILLSKTYLKLGLEKEALEHAAEAFEKSTSVKNNVLAMESCSVLAEIYEATNQSKEAIHFLHLASLFKDTILDQSIRGSMQAKMFDLDLEKEKREKNQVISSLTQKDLQLTRQRYVLLSAGGALISLLIITFLVRKAGLERQRINKLLMANNLQLNKLNQEVNGLINTIVHDLKSPLNSMHGLLYLLETEVKDNKEAQHLIQQGNKVLTGGHEIIRQLLELRELEEKPPIPKPELISLREFVEGLREEHASYSKQKQIELLTESSDTQIRLDRLLTKRLLANLLSNAIKFSPSGKQVVLKAVVQEAAVIFEVIDQGQGFTEMDRQKIFQKFQKLSARPTAGESSHGLGLAIVQLLSQQLKATIDLKSEAGKGAAFIISIPTA